MRLLNSCSGEMKHFLSYGQIPPYAILSHTWGDDEVSYQDWLTLPASDVEKKKGFQKIDYCCQQAARDGLEWVWVDTCCIDKTSSAELTESINSMFRWYKASSICYAYLEDVPKNLRLSTIEKKLARSRWFTRGWTLQELIAPCEVLFYSHDWHAVGTRSQLSGCISGITGIEETYLNGASLQFASVAQRMSWASQRLTSRDEDVAYCLLGIFDVNMPLIYGEGLKAFQRLQEEIMKAYPEDHTLFAWGSVSPHFTRLAKSEAQVLGEEAIEPVEEEEGEEGDLLGFLARSPSDFAESGRFVCYRDAKKFFRRWDFPLTAPTTVGRTTRLDLPVRHTGPPFAVCRMGEELGGAARLRRVTTAVLVCGRQDGPWFKFVTIPLLTCTGGYYGRTRELVVNELISLPRVNYDVLGRWRVQLVVERQPRYQARAGDIILRRFVSFVACATSIAAETVDVAIDDGFIKALAPTHGRVACLTFEYSDLTGLGLNISRVGDSEDGTGNLYFSLMPVDIRAPSYWDEAAGEYKEVPVEQKADAEFRGEAEEIKGGEQTDAEMDEEGQGKGSGSESEEEENEGEESGEEGDEEEEEGGAEEVEEEEDDDEDQADASDASETASSDSASDKDEIMTDSPSSPKPSIKDDDEEEEDKKSSASIRPRFQTTLEGYYYLWDHWQQAPYQQEMKLPADTWELDQTNEIPNVRITTERMYIDDDPSQPVDVVDIVIRADWGQENQGQGYIDPYTGGALA
ncbi:heterokaryon incompatibility protein-domain-containing protein [Jackrogersella minutella]|nr:heterokaryon incompatibility protein-domain-containing protein [Jackrogersella minutella]